MKGITINTRKKLLDLIDEHKKDTRKEGLENLASDLQITPEFAQNPDIDYLTKKRDRIFEMNNRSTGVIK